MLLAFPLAYGINCFGQVSATNIRGAITYQDSIPAAGAKVIARHEPSGSLYAAIADTSGAFVIPSVPIGGPYRMEVSLDGFETFSRADIYLTLKTFTLDVGLNAREGKNIKSTGARYDHQPRYPAVNRRSRAR